MHIQQRERLLAAEDKAVNDGFQAYNLEQGQSSDRIPVALAVTGEAGQLLGALDGYIFFDYLTVSRLWVDPTVRGTGVGKALMEKAESFARESGCVGSTLSTYDFQARPFYEKLGYAVFGLLPNNPRGRERFFMMKPLTEKG